LPITKLNILWWRHEFYKFPQIPQIPVLKARFRYYLSQSSWAGLPWVMWAWLGLGVIRGKPINQRVQRPKLHSTIDMSAADIQKMNVCWNNVYRRVFGMNLWESVKELQLLCNRLDYVRIVYTWKLKFWFCLKLCDNKILYWCSKWLCYNAKFSKLCSEYNMNVGSNYCMCVYLRFYHIVMDNIV